MQRFKNEIKICVISQLEHAYVMWKKMEMSKPLSQSIYKFSPLKWRDRDANGWNPHSHNKNRIFYYYGVTMRLEPLGGLPKESMREYNMNYWNKKEIPSSREPQKRWSSTMGEYKLQSGVWPSLLPQTLLMPTASWECKLKLERSYKQEC